MKNVLILIAVILVAMFAWSAFMQSEQEDVEGVVEETEQSNDTATSVSPSIVEDFEGEANPDTMTLGMTEWRWVKTIYNNDTEVEPKEFGVFTLTFNEEEGTVSAQTDCNAIFGPYIVEENKITFGPLAMTRMFCQDSQEQVFADMLNEAQSYLFTSKGELILELPLDTGSVIFR